MEKQVQPIIYRAFLAESRLRRRLTQSQVARFCGVSKSAYQKYEYGQRTPGKRVMRKLSQLLLIPEEALQKTGGMTRREADFLRKSPPVPSRKA